MHIYRMLCSELGTPYKKNLDNLGTLAFMSVRIEIN